MFGLKCVNVRYAFLKKHIGWDHDLSLKGKFKVQDTV